MYGAFASRSEAAIISRNVCAVRVIYKTETKKMEQKCTALRQFSLYLKEVASIYFNTLCVKCY